MEHPNSFGYWLRRRRKALDLTQEELARRVGCAVSTIKSIEADERRPSKQMAALLADGLEVSGEERLAFIKAARAELQVDQLPFPGPLAALPQVANTPTHLPSTEAASQDEVRPILKEERRLVTVLFADISGFTSPMEQLDPEEFKVVSDRYVARISQQIQRFGGTVVNVLGAAVFAVFGVPVAHEDDASRAVRAAVVISSSPPLDDGTAAVKLHMSINTGEVLTTIRSAHDLRSYTVLGGAVNTAARILKAAAPGTILVGEATFRATRQAVQYRELASVAATGTGDRYGSGRC